MSQAIAIDPKQNEMLALIRDYGIAIEKYAIASEKGNLTEARQYRERAADIRSAIETRVINATFV